MKTVALGEPSFIIPSGASYLTVFSMTFQVRMAQNLKTFEQGCAEIMAVLNRKPPGRFLSARFAEAYWNGAGPASAPYFNPAPATPDRGWSPPDTERNTNGSEQPSQRNLLKTRRGMHRKTPVASRWYWRRQSGRGPEQRIF